MIAAPGQVAVMKWRGGLLEEGMTLLPPGSSGQAWLTGHAGFIDVVTKEFPGVVTRTSGTSWAPRAGMRWG
jgi:hypothetical protein